MSGNPGNPGAPAAAATPVPLVPTLKRPAGATDPQQTLDPMVPAPEDVPLPPDQTAVRYLLQKGYLNPLPQNRFEPERPMTKAEFVTLLYRASDYNLPFACEFPFYRDVPTTHWAYLPIEVIRMRDFLPKSENGYFHPESPITRSEAGVMMSKTLGRKWFKLLPEEIEATLAAYPDPLPALSKADRYDLARSVYAGFLSPVYRMAPHATAPERHLDPGASLTRMDAARMIYRRALLSDETQPSQALRYTWLPVGTSMVVSPTTAIALNQTFVGNIIYFATTEPVPIAEWGMDMPRGTRIHGKVVSVDPTQHTVSVALDKAIFPAGDTYLLNAELTLGFQGNRDQEAFIVPGQHYPLQTRQP